MSVAGDDSLPVRDRHAVAVAPMLDLMGLLDRRQRPVRAVHDVAVLELAEDSPGCDGEVVGEPLDVAHRPADQGHRRAVARVLRRRLGVTQRLQIPHRPVICADYPL